MNLQRYLIIKKGYPQKTCFFTTVQMRWVKIDLGFVVPKRIEKLAVKRNYMRRSLREIFKNIFKSNHHYSFDFIVSIKKTFYKDEFHLLKAQVDSLFLKVTSLKK